MTVVQARTRRTAIAAEMRGIHDAANGAALDDAGQTRWAALETEATTLNSLEARAAALDALDRRSAGQHVAGTGDTHLDRMVEGVGLLDAIRSQMGATDAAAGRAREVSQELERRSGRKAQGMLWSMGGAEQRSITTTLPVAGPGGQLIPVDYRPDLFIDRLRNATRVRSLGATLLTGLAGNVVIPRRKGSALSGWVAENTPLALADQSFNGITLSPRHAGVVTEYSRNMIMQASPDIEMLCRNDMSLVLAEALDAAAIAGTGGASNQPLGILNTAGIGSIAIGVNGGPMVYDNVADLIGQVDDLNADGSATGFLMNTKTRRAAVKLKDTQGHPLGLPVVFQGKPMAFSNIVPSNGTKGTGTGLSSLIYANWADLLIGVWSELDILVNPYESTAYAKGSVSIRAMMTCDIAVRHPESFAAITDIVA